MFFRQVLHEDLGCASYVVADGGEAAVIDPKWEIEDYLELADQHSLRIAHVLETHNHADHLSGRGRLVKATGATVHISAEAGVDYEHRTLADGDVLELGEARITARRTPGHRPEHLAFVVEDRSRADVPALVLSGDSLFVGDVARPDLAVEPEEGARGLFLSLRTILELEDFVEVWPGHIGGSLCGGAGMSERPASTVGEERRFNPYLPLDERAFVARLTSEQTPQPPNFERIVELNRGPQVAEPAALEALTPERVQQLLENGAFVIDGREPHEFDGGHVPGSVNVTAVKSGFGTRAAWVVEPEADVVMVAGSDDQAVRLGRLLEAVGFRSLSGFLAGAIGGWRSAGLEIGSTPAIDVATLAQRLRDEEVRLVDVREPDEWRDGHVRHSIHVPYYELRHAIPEEIRAEHRPLAVACSVGIRSSTAVSLLKRAGIENVEHVAAGGIKDLEDEGIKLEPGE